MNEKDMKLEVLVSTMHQKDVSLVSKMNITSDAIIINQGDYFDYIEVEESNRTIKMYSFNERGVGKSRNNALMRSTADICLIADDDVVYVDNYEDIIIEGFKDNPKADMIIFNVSIIDKDGEVTRNQKNKRVRFFNSLKYGAVSLTFKREEVFKKNIFFSLLFGGGAKYGAGEDSLFIIECLRKGLKIYTSSSKIADVYNYESSWFTGYNEKYFFDKGAFFASISRRFAFLLSLQDALRKYSIYKNHIDLVDALKYMLRGSKHYNSR